VHVDLKTPQRRYEVYSLSSRLNVPSVGLSTFQPLLMATPSQLFQTDFLLALFLECSKVECCVPIIDFHDATFLVCWTGARAVGRRDD